MPASVIQGSCYSNYFKIITNHLILLQAKSDFFFFKAYASSQGENCILWDKARAIILREGPTLFLLKSKLKQVLTV